MPRQAPAKRQAAARSKLLSEFLSEYEELRVPSQLEEEAQLQAIEEEWMQFLEAIPSVRHVRTLLRLLASSELENDRLTVEIEQLEKHRLSSKSFLSLQKIDPGMGLALLSPEFAKRLSPLVTDVIAAAAAADRSVRSSRSATQGHSLTRGKKAKAFECLERNANLSKSQQKNKLVELFPNLSPRTLENYVTDWRKRRKGIP